MAVSVVALLPVASYVAPSLPFATQPIVHPTALVSRTPPPRPASALGSADALLSENSLTWQALNQMHYALASGTGAEADPSRAGRDKAAEIYLDEMSSPFLFVPIIKPTDILEVRQAIGDWGVTTVVIPYGGPAPTYEWLLLQFQLRWP